jgi:hypothetical protein
MTRREPRTASARPADSRAAQGRSGWVSILVARGSHVGAQNTNQETTFPARSWKAMLCTS